MSDPKQEKLKSKLIQSDIQKNIYAIAEKADRIISDELFALSKEECDGKALWLMKGRIINLLFSNHYRASIVMAEDAINKEKFNARTT